MRFRITPSLHYTSVIEADTIEDACKDALKRSMHAEYTLNGNSLTLWTDGHWGYECNEYSIAPETHTNDERMNILLEVDRALFLMEETRDYSAKIMDECLACNAPWESDEYLDDLHQELSDLIENISQTIGYCNYGSPIDQGIALTNILKQHGFIPYDNYFLTDHILAASSVHRQRPFKQKEILAHNQV